jgi:hypothetical protein
MAKPAPNDSASRSIAVRRLVRIMGILNLRQVGVHNQVLESDIDNIGFD